MAEKSITLYKLMVHKGYPEAFSKLICQELSTDFTADRMIHYIASGEQHTLEDIADEMLSIKDFRDSIIRKHIAEHAQSKINELYNEINEGIDVD